MSPVHAPDAPGRLGEAVEVMAMQAYLTELDAWVRFRKDELDELDAAALASPRKNELTGDMTLSMALWKAVSDRLQLLLAVWGGGRVLEAERERLATLIHGRLDATLDPDVLARSAAIPGSTPGALAVSLPEACRLNDALAGQLRQRLSLDPAADENAARVKDLRAALERLRDQVSLEPDASRTRAQRTWDELAARIKDVTERLQRGGDVGGLLGPLENDAAMFERDLIVGSAERRDARDRAAAAAELRDDLAGPRGRARAARRALRRVRRPRAPLRRPRRRGARAGARLADRARRLPQAARAGRRGDEPRPRVVRRRARGTRRPRRPARRADPKASAQRLSGERDLAAAEATAREVLARHPCPVAVARRSSTRTTRGSRSRPPARPLRKAPDEVPTTRLHRDHRRRLLRRLRHGARRGRRRRRVTGSRDRR